MGYDPNSRARSQPSHAAPSLLSTGTALRSEQRSTSPPSHDLDLASIKNSDLANTTCKVNGASTTSSAEAMIHPELPTMLETCPLHIAPDTVEPVMACPVDPEAAVRKHQFWMATNHHEPGGIIGTPMWIIDLLTEGNEMLVMSQTNFWFRLDDGKPPHLRAQAVVGGHIWVVKTFADLGAEIHRSARQVETAVTGLRAKGYLIVEHHRNECFYRGLVVSHFRPNWDKISEEHAKVVSKWSTRRNGPNSGQATYRHT